MCFVIAAMGLVMAMTMVQAAGHSPCDIEGLPGQVEMGEVSVEAQGTVSIMSFTLNGDEKRYAVPTPAGPGG